MKKKRRNNKILDNTKGSILSITICCIFYRIRCGLSRCTGFFFKSQILYSTMYQPKWSIQSQIYCIITSTTCSVLYRLTRVTQRVLLVEHELPTLLPEHELPTLFPEHELPTFLPEYPRFLMRFVLLYLWFSVKCLQIIVCPFFRFAIVLSVLLIIYLCSHEGFFLQTNIQCSLYDQVYYIIKTYMYFCLKHRVLTGSRCTVPSNLTVSVRSRIKLRVIYGPLH